MIAGQVAAVLVIHDVFIYVKHRIFTYAEILAVPFHSPRVRRIELAFGGKISPL